MRTRTGLLYEAVWAVTGMMSALAAAGAQPITQTYAITNDCYLDSRSPTYNYGVSTTCKVVVNGSDGSLARSVFKLPENLPPVPQVGLISAKVWFYVWFDQTGSRTVRLHPLKRAFAEGSGDQTPADDGASWLTADGVQPWTTPGGDYDATVYVDAVEGANWFSWDITALWNNADLRSSGALLRMNDESNPGSGNMPRAPFTSSDGPLSQHPYLEITYLPCSLTGGDAPVRQAADINGDCIGDMTDVALFVDVLLGLEPEPFYVANCDLDGNGTVDGRDVRPFIQAFLTQQP